MSANVRYVHIGLGNYGVYTTDDIWLGDVFINETGEWHGYAKNSIGEPVFVGTAETRHEAADLIFKAVLNERP